MSIVLYCIVSFIANCRLRTGGQMLLQSLPSRAFFIVILLGINLYASAQDTTRREQLEAVTVSSQRTPSTLRTATPTQVIEAEQIANEGALQLSDAVKHMAGVTLKDYGGIGGIKTVSSRGLGSQFSTLTIDGVAVDDAQNGQVDLGRYLLGNTAYISLSQGQQEEPLLSAKAYAAGSVLNVESREPQFFMVERTNLKLGMDLGSFNMLSPSLLWEQKWSRRLKSSLWVNYLKSDGDYPFTLYYTTSQRDSTSRERRQHSAMHMFTTDANLFYTIATGNTLTTKVHYMRGRHQLPGPVQYYTQKVSAESTEEEVAFAQTKWRVEKGRWKMQLLGKLQHTYDLWQDSAATTSVTGYACNIYRQDEAYLSGSGAWTMSKHWELRTAVDGSLSHLISNLAQRNDVLRRNLTAVGAVRYSIGNFEANAHLLYTDIADRVADLDTMPRYARLSPYASAIWKINTHTTLRYFYKETYRAPNFSELYFFTMPRDLRPEHARQHNIGLTHCNQLSTVNYQLTVDGYYNHVTDKIIAVPTQSMFLWSMQNVGIVDILGIDLTTNFQISTFSFQLNYSYQHAVDHTNQESRTYGHQIAYTPRHSGGATMRWEHPWVNLGASAMVIGERYYRMQNTDLTRLPAYCDLSLSADRTFDLRLGTVRFQLQVLNLLDIQYEVVRSYPMMGRNYRFSIMYEF